MAEMKHACQPASIVLRSSPNEPEITHIWDKLNSYWFATRGAHTFMLAFAPKYWSPLTYPTACCAAGKKKNYLLGHFDYDIRFM